MEIRRISRRLMRTRFDDDSDESEILLGVQSAVREERPAEAGDMAGVRPSPGGFVRPLENEDVASIAELHARIMPNPRGLPPEEIRTQLERLLLQHPWRHQYLKSLVFEQRGGKVAGCIGVMPRPMVFQGRPITAAISHSFIVEPGNRSMLPALTLAQNFLSGPQDLSLAETGKVSRKLWEKAGGEVSLLYTLCWTRPLKPSRYALSFLHRRGLPNALERGMRPACNLLDRLAPLAGRSFRQSASPAVIAAGGLTAQLDAASFCETFTNSTHSRAIHAQYDPSSADWMLQTLAQKSGRGDFHRVLVRNSQREAVGWYLYYLIPDGIGTVVQLGARDGSAEMVFDHLCRHAAEHGAIAISGQLDPAFFHTLAARDCLFHHDGGSSFLIHSRNPEILQAIHRGEAFLTRLESEWWISFLLS